MERQVKASVLVLLAVFTLTGLTYAADPMDTVLFTNSGVNAGHWRLAHGTPGFPVVPFYPQLDMIDHGGNVLYNKSDAGWTPQPNIPLVGDVTGDGYDDILTVVWNPGDNKPYFFINATVEVAAGIGMLMDGSADFWRGTEGAGTHFLLGDINGDGREDLLNVKPSGTIYQWTAYHSTGMGTGLRTWAFTGEKDEKPLVGDFNGDGIDDIALRFESGARTPLGWIKVYLSDADGDGLQNGGDAGTGTHDGYQTSDIVQGSVSNTAPHVATLVGDINGDGIDDIVELDDRYGNGNWVWVCGLTGPKVGPASGFAINASGVLSWCSPFNLSGDETVAEPFLADMNGDGFDDLLVYREFVADGWTYGQWLVALNDGDGDLFGVSYSGSGTTRLRGDWDDNIPLVGQFGAPAPLEDCDNGYVDDDYDGLPDCLDPDCKLNPDCACFGLEDDTVLFNNTASAARAGYWSLSHTRCAAEQTAGNWHGEWDFGGALYFNSGSYTPNPNLPFLGDVNGDGFDDLVRVASNGGVQVFAASFTYDANEAGLGLLGPGSPSDFIGTDQAGVIFLLADVNGDGYDDAINIKPTAGDPNAYQVTAYHSGPDGFGVDTNGDEITDKSWMFPSEGVGNRFFAADFDGDGTDDIAVRFEDGVLAPEGWFKVYLSGPNGLRSHNDFGAPTTGYTTAEIVQGKVSDTSPHIATLIGDVNADGKADIVEVDDRNGTSIWVWVAGMTGACGDPSGLCINATGLSWAQPMDVQKYEEEPNTVEVPVLADINGDGYDDLVVWREYAYAHASGDTGGEWLVALNDADDDLFGLAFYGSAFRALEEGHEGNVPLIGQFDLPGAPVGACCLPDTACIEVTEAECLDQSGTYAGDDTICAETVCCPDLPFDYDDDKDIDQVDFAQFQRCLTVGGGAILPGCECFDRDGTPGIDGDDLLIFLDCASGPNILADPACDNN